MRWENIPKRELIILNLILVIYFLCIFFQLPVYANDYFLLYTNDSKEYFSTGYEFFDLNTKGYSETRPFLFPLFLRIGYSVGGAYFVWLLHSILWVISANLIYFSLKKWTRKITFALIGTILFSINLSLIALTFHGLTEIVTVFILSLLIFTLSRNKERIFTSTIFLKVTAIFVVLTLVKPMFFPPLIALLIIGFWFYIKSFLSNKKHFLWLVVILLPLLIQVTVMYKKYDKLTVSTISELTYKNYFVTQGIEKNEKIPRESALVKVNNMSKAEVNKYVKSHLDIYYEVCKENLKNNVYGFPNYLALNKSATNKAFVKFMIEVNSIYYGIFLIIRVLFILITVYWFFKKAIKKNVAILFLMLLYLYIIFSSMISTYQGDRLTISSVPVLTFIIVILMHLIISKVQSIINQRKINS